MSLPPSTPPLQDDKRETAIPLSVWFKNTDCRLALPQVYIPRYLFDTLKIEMDLKLKALEEEKK